MFGVSTPSVKIAEPFEDIMFAPEMRRKDYEPQFTRTGYLSVLKPSIINFCSAARSLNAVRKNMTIEGFRGMVYHTYNDSLQHCRIKLL